MSAIKKLIFSRGVISDKPPYLNQKTYNARVATKLMGIGLCDPNTEWGVILDSLMSEDQFNWISSLPSGNIPEGGIPIRRNITIGDTDMPSGWYVFNTTSNPPIGTHRYRVDGNSTIIEKLIC